jgi:hypothetical protein
MELTGSERRELKRLVMNKYPVTKAEAQCADERRMMADVREKHKRELLNWYKEKGTFNGFVSRIDLIIQQMKP